MPEYWTEKIRPLTGEDIEKVAEKTGYTACAVRAILAGRRRLNRRNCAVVTTAIAIARLRAKSEDALNRKIENL